MHTYDLVAFDIYRLLAYNFALCPPTSFNPDYALEKIKGYAKTFE